jgi:ubiquinone/menaquinone biosynthesis C-methylase UbiE
MTRTDTYDPRFFEEIKKVEEKHFWFRVRRRWILDKLEEFLPPPAKFLEVGCGTGNVSSFLARKGYIVTGCEYYSEAIGNAWPGFQIIQGDANNLPFEDNNFDAVGLFDVLEHFQDEITPLQEAVRVVKERGIILITVPAREELWSWVDEISLHKRRYTKESLRKNFIELQLEALLTEYLFMSLYLPMKYVRGKNKKSDDIFRIGRIANILLSGIFETERLISKVFPLPVGTSLIAIARKK